MSTSLRRESVGLLSHGVRCAGWHYRGSNGACVVMAGGFAVPKEPATDRFARRFHEAGFSVLAFDYRRLGESEGQRRLVLPIKDQLADWEAALAFAATLPEVDAARIAAWGFSLSGGHILRIAARSRGVAAAIAQTPMVDGRAATRAAAAHQTRGALVRLTWRGLMDVVGGLVGGRPRLVPLTGEPGTVAVLTTPDGRQGPEALSPAGRYPEWRQEVAAGSAVQLGLYRPFRDAHKVGCPLLVVVCDGDQTNPPAPAAEAAARAPQGHLVRLPGGHYGPFLEAHEEAVEAELGFLREHLLVTGAAGSPGSAGTKVAS
jgi:pimeloyl-ACP methyl ester carboxylesterase